MTRTTTFITHNPPRDEHPAKPALVSALARNARVYGLTPTAIDLLAREARIVSSKGMICHSGDGDGIVNFVLTGSMVIELVPQCGEESTPAPLVLKIVGPNEFFCLPHSPRDESYFLRAVPLEPGLIVLWQRTTLVHLMGALVPSGLVDLLTTSWLALSRLNEAFCLMLRLRLSDRLLFILPRLARRFGRPDDAGGVTIDLPLDDSTLARIVGSTRAPVNRAMRAFVTKGVLEREGKHVRMLRPVSRP